MAFTRVWQAGAELQALNESSEYVSASYGGGSMTVSSTKAKTGSYSFRSGTNDYPRGYAGVLTQFRAGVFINHNGVSGTVAGRKSFIFVVPTTGITNVEVYWDHNTSLLNLVVNGTAVDTIDVGAAGFSTTNTWFHLGITYKAHASTGFVSVYLDGTKILEFTGNTGTQADGVYFGGRSTSINGWTNYAYFDDFYVDSASGDADAAPPSYRFLWQAVNAAGTSAAWTATGASPNYACVDDAVPNDDTDYISAASSGLVDYYNTASVAVPTGYVINAVIPTGWAKKTDAGTDSEIKLGTRLSGTDVDGTAQNLPTAYGLVFERHATKPGGGSWSESDANSAEIKIESAGAF